MSSQSPEICGEWVPVRDYFKSRMVHAALQAKTNSSRKKRLLMLYEAEILTSGEVMNLIEKNELRNA